MIQVFCPYFLFGNNRILAPLDTILVDDLLNKLGNQVDAIEGLQLTPATDGGLDAEGQGCSMIPYFQTRNDLGCGNPYSGRGAKK